MAEHAADHMPSHGADDRAPSSRITGRLVWGIIFLGLGVAWTLDNLGFLESAEIVRWWPILLVAFGIAKLTGWGARRSTLPGTLYLVAGGWLILHELDLVRSGIGGLIPLALVVLGARIVIFAMRRPEPVAESAITAGGLDARGRVRLGAVMSTVERRIHSGAFSGGELNAVMGSIELDLRDATLAPGRVELEANAVMAGIVLRVPRGWRVVSDASCVMGAVEDHTASDTESKASQDTLLLRGTAIMAGIEIKH